MSQTTENSNVLQSRLVRAFAEPNSPKLTQAGLARACGVSPPSVSAWFNGETKNIDGKHLLLAAEYLGVSPKWLIGLSDVRSETIISDEVKAWQSNKLFTDVCAFSGFGKTKTHSLLFERITVNLVIQPSQEFGQEVVHNYFSDEGVLLFTGPSPFCPF